MGGRACGASPPRVASWRPPLARASLFLFCRLVVRLDEGVLFFVELCEELLGTEEVGLGLIDVGLGVEALPAGQVFLPMLAGGPSQKVPHLPNICGGQDWIVHSALARALVPGSRHVVRSL